MDNQQKNYNKNNRRRNTKVSRDVDAFSNISHVPISVSVMGVAAEGNASQKWSNAEIRSSRLVVQLGLSTFYKQKVTSC